MPIGDALGGFAEGLAGGLAARKKGGSLVDRFKKAFGREVPTEAMEPLPGDQDGPVIPSKRVPIAHKGGRISKTGNYKLKAGEVVLPADVAKGIRGKKRTASRKSSRGSRR